MSGMTTPAAVLVDAAAYAVAVETAKKAAAAYYATGESALDDDAYDRMARGIAAYEEAHPGEVSADSPSGKVAGGAAVGDVPHTVPMLSLDNVFGGDEFTTWAASVERRIGRPVECWNVEAKLDGLAVAARYEDGGLVRLITRGDGLAGEDVSHATGMIAGLPDRLAEPVTLEVRGEVLMTTEQFERANTLRTGHGGTPFANPRGAAAGSVRAKDRPYRVEMTFFAYAALPLATTGPELAAALTGDSHGEVLARVAALGVHTTAATAAPPRTVTDADAVRARVEEIAALRPELPFGIDGIVIKADAAADQLAAGSGSRAPRWAIAWKLPAVEKVTRLLDVEWNVGRTGTIAPRAVLEPVVIDGSTVAYATLHNPNDITRRDLRIGDQVMVYKAGDIIPRVEAPVAHLRTGEEKAVVFPEVCPQCGSDIDTTEQRWRCVRGRNCHLVASVSYAAGRDQFDIEGLGATRVVQLVDSGLVGDIGDLFSLTREQILGLDRMGETSTDNLLAAIGRAKGRPLSRVLAALGVRGTGRSMSRRIARHFASMDVLCAADEEAMRRVEGIGTEKARAIVAELADLAELIGKLRAAGVNMTEPGATPPSDDPSAAEGSPGAVGAEVPAEEGPLSGMTVVVTGSMTGPLEKLSRNGMNELIERAGGKSSSGVSKRTSLLVAGGNAGSKREKAEQLGIRIASPDEFAELIAEFLAAEADATVTADAADTGADAMAG
ncbi:NAD-dependent DNA ligase LigA [Streptomyces sp. NBC_01498]|uniref:NAD-dependent DNA ligase LigA n=1 Tax=Streptomyces sp. NBC_01498 TaxID=2975870 RepID=UPI002E7B3711|nr:NAD-dependent DNA ligase LigA [Streptomyces sp. NBC_01498]WTL23357.1 NAD-dependent DNA ligase LigA [Streptomyces sp. NBC_01498]